ncbi:MAG: carboxypeptidase-like regulatory domain-containing protein [Gemmataceae bacterium]
MNAKAMVALTLTLLAVGRVPAQTAGPRIEGVVVNGSQDGAKVAGAAVVLRAGLEGALRPEVQTVTDAEGRFVFDKLVVDPDMVFLPGANHQGVHYPGPRLQIPGGATTSPVKLVVFDAVASPSPLVVELHEIDVHLEAGVLEVTQTLRIRNPSQTTYVGQAGSMSSLATLSLTIPDGFERVTFHDEFNGRRFKLVDKRLVTDIPWTPGRREVKFSYRLPVEEANRALEWSIDAPCSHVRLRVHGENAERFASDLGEGAARDDGSVLFESVNVPAGHKVALQAGSGPTPWIVYLRWSALGLLGVLILGTAALRLRRRSRGEPPAPEKTKPSPKGRGSSKRKTGAKAA